MRKREQVSSDGAKKRGLRKKGASSAPSCSLSRETLMREKEVEKEKS